MFADRLSCRRVLLLFVEILPRGHAASHSLVVTLTSIGPKTHARSQSYAKLLSPPGPHASEGGSPAKRLSVPGKFDKELPEISTGYASKPVWG